MEKQPCTCPGGRKAVDHSSSDYADRQAAADATYAREYPAWVAALSPEERARLATLGLDKPDISRRTSTHQGDAISLALTAAPEPSPLAAAAEADSAPQSVSVSAADALASFAARVRAHPNPLLALDAYCFASGLMGVEGVSQSSLAARHGVTRAAFSKLAVQWCQTFGLSPSRGMRSKRARRVYREARLNSLAKQHEHTQTKP
jgi:hypothetical protein